LIAVFKSKKIVELLSSSAGVETKEIASCASVVRSAFSKSDQEKSLRKIDIVKSTFGARSWFESGSRREIVSFSS
jgi:hypothetical protein